MIATRDGMKKAARLYERLERLKEAKSVINTGRVTIVLGDLEDARFSPTGADFISDIREGAANDINAQTEAIKRELSDLGYEG